MYFLLLTDLKRIFFMVVLLLTALRRGSDVF